MDKKRLSAMFFSATLLSDAAKLPAAPLTSAFNFQGQLRADGAPLNGLADLQFKLWDDEILGEAYLDINTLLAVPVVNGLFSVELDFGAENLNDVKKWISIEVRHPSARSGPFAALSPRQPINAAPIALYALNAGSGGGGGSLDAAYDNGGAGAGRTITADSGAVNIAGPDGLTVAGPVGVGTINPQSELDVFDADTIAGIPSGTHDTRLGIRHDLSVIGGGTTHRWMTFRAGSDTAVTRYDGSDLHFEIEDPRSSTPVKQMTLTDNGRLGIGTSSPKQRLHVNGDYYGRGHMYLHAFEGDGNNGTAYIQARDDSGSSDIALRLRSQENGAVRDVMTLTPEGDVQLHGSLDMDFATHYANGCNPGTAQSAPYTEISCLPGYRVMTGGCSVFFLIPSTTLVGSYPEDVTTWRCDWNQCIDGPTYTAYVVCARMK